MPLLILGKGTWSLAALTNKKRYDLLSLDTEGSLLWKSKASLSKVQLEREQLMRRVFGFSAEKEKDLKSNELLARLQLSTNSIIYFILRRLSSMSSNSNAQMLVDQEIILENIANVDGMSILRPTV
jgi:hypothetical protein